MKPLVKATAVLFATLGASRPAGAGEPASPTAEQGSLVATAAPPAMHSGFSASGDMVIRANPMGAILFAGLSYRVPYRFDVQRQMESAAV